MLTQESGVTNNPASPTTPVEAQRGNVKEEKLPPSGVAPLIPFVRSAYPTQLGISEIKQSCKVLKCAWDIYYRLPACADWTLQGYSVLRQNVQTAEELAYILISIKDTTVKGCMFFIMRAGVPPIWECNENIQGGFFSFSVQSADIWRNMIYAMCGNTLFNNSNNTDQINGISITPKKGYMTLKLWFCSDTIQRLTDMIEVPGIQPLQAVFHYHNIQTAVAPVRKIHEKHNYTPGPHRGTKYGGNNKNIDNKARDNYSSKTQTPSRWSS